MQKISSKNVINKLIQLTGWNKTKIAKEIFGIKLSNLGNYVREDRLDFYKIFEWSKKKNIDIDFNWLLGNNPCDPVDYKIDKPFGLVCDENHNANDLLKMTREVLESDTHWAESLSSNIQSFYKGLKDRRKKDCPDKIPDGINRRKKVVG